MIRIGGEHVGSEITSIPTGTIVTRGFSKEEGYHVNSLKRIACKRKDTRI